MQIFFGIRYEESNCLQYAGINKCIPQSMRTQFSDKTEREVKGVEKPSAQQGA